MHGSVIDFWVCLMTLTPEGRVWASLLQTAASCHLPFSLWGVSFLLLINCINREAVSTFCGVSVRGREPSTASHWSTEELFWSIREMPAYLKALKVRWRYYPNGNLREEQLSLGKKVYEPEKTLPPDQRERTVLSLLFNVSNQVSSVSWEVNTEIRLKDQTWTRFLGRTCKSMRGRD